MTWRREIVSNVTKALGLVVAGLLVATVGLGSRAASAAVNGPHLTSKKNILGERGRGGPPSLNVKPSCEAAADRTAMEQMPGTNVRDVASCMRDENEARDQLAKEWAQFSRADQQNCTSITTTGGIPSYVELLVCLEMNRDAKNYSETAPTPSRPQRK
jgi:hypothetical protein